MVHRQTIIRDRIPATRIVGLETVGAEHPDGWACVLVSRDTRCSPARSVFGGLGGSAGICTSRNPCNLRSGLAVYIRGARTPGCRAEARSEEHTSELQSLRH